MPDNVGKDDVVTGLFSHVQGRQGDRRTGTLSSSASPEARPRPARCWSAMKSAIWPSCNLISVPANATALYLAKESCPRPGETVHAIGNPEARPARLWVHTSGDVRQVYHKNWNSGPPGNPNQFSLSAMVVETQVPANPGDSGGPLVNTYGGPDRRDPGF